MDDVARTHGAHGLKQTRRGKIERNRFLKNQSWAEQPQRGETLKITQATNKKIPKTSKPNIKQ